MIITPHLLIGGAIGLATNNVPLAFVLGFFSHLILDLIPHLDPGTFQKTERGTWPKWFYWFVICEFIIIWTIFILLFRDLSQFPAMVSGAIGAIMMDIMDNIPIKSMDNWPMFKQVHVVHDKFHFFLDKKYWYWGLIDEAIVTAGGLWLLLK